MNQYKREHLNVQDLLKRTKRDANNCFVWQQNLDKDGYPYLWVNSHSTRAHSYMCRLIHGERPDSMVTMHSCDNPSCINPDHLSWGTQRANIQDKYARNRGNNPKGEKHPFAKLTAEIVLSARESHYKNKISINQLSKYLGVSYRTAYDAIKGNSWLSVGGLP